MFLSKIGVPQTCFEIALTWSTGRSNFENKKDPRGTTYKIGLTISSRKNGCPCKRNYNDRSSTQGGRGARHDIMLPGHKRPVL